jgi:hypothetical protein
VARKEFHRHFREVARAICQRLLAPRRAL